MAGFQRRRVPEEVDKEAVLSLLKDAIDLMDRKQSEAYLKALSVCPEVVEKESNPLEFLSFDDFDIWKAAQRLMNYWKWRVDLFTEERAFLPILDLTGEGALDQSDMRLMKSGVITMLPKTVYGVPVFFGDRRRAGDDLLFVEKLDSGLRICFAWHHFLVREQGTDWGFLDFLPNIPPFLVGKKNWAQMIEEALPIRIKWVRFVVVPTKNEKRTWFERILPRIQEAIYKNLGYTTAAVRFYDSVQDLKGDLLSSGFLEQGLPESIGGTWSYENFYSWLAEKSTVLGETNFKINKEMKTTSVEVAKSEIQKPKAAVFQKSDAIQNAACTESTEQVAPQQYEDTNKLLLDSMMSPISHGKTDSAISNLPPAMHPMEIAIESFSPEDKATLMTMKTKVPEIFREESYLNSFYQYHNQQADEAVTHLERFFKLRDNLFGDKTFHRMNQLGLGALKQNDLKTLNTSFLTILPPDREENQVIFYDPSRCAVCRFASQRRCWYYVFSLLLRWAAGERSKVKLIIHIKKDSADHETKYASGRRKLYDILNAFPVEISKFHLILDSEWQDDKNYVENATMAVISLLQPALGQAVFHTSTPGVSISEALLLHGFKKEGIPSSFGGGLGDDWFQSLRLAIIKEEENLHGKTQVTRASPQGLGEKETLCANLKRKQSEKTKNQLNAATNVPDSDFSPSPLPNQLDRASDDQETPSFASTPIGGIGSLFNSAAPLSISDIVEYSSQQFGGSADHLTSLGESPASMVGENAITQAQLQSHQSEQQSDDFIGWSSTFRVHLADYWRRRIEEPPNREKS